MLRLVKITKDYKLADTTVRALKGVSLSFRANEFVSILGPSGCGKTTLLNLIGGLDKYTSGDMHIAGRSTREFKDSDWDVYRNHRVGFIFQSYNLIPHQTVLGNVELALTIAGIAKNEREARAKAALDKVGLSDQYNKKPNQLSGGQCQRVAIARALVNDPEVLLADEPTGALDTKTSVQIMDLIKEIAQERLVIMVTHNPELAEQYSTRIIKLLDGELLDDTNPFSAEEEIQECQQKADAQALADNELTKSPTTEPTDNVGSQSALHTDKTNSEPSKRNEPTDNVGSPSNIHKRKANSEPSKRKEKAKMSFFTAFRLSLQNLFTKKARTIMTSIAGSIGIIGISLVLSISYGVQSFINNMQNDMLSGNPVEIAETAYDVNSMMSGNNTGETLDFVKENGYINVNSMMKNMLERFQSMNNIMVQNNIEENYINYLKDMPKDYYETILFSYGLDITNNIYTTFKADKESEKEQISLSGIKAVYTSLLGHTDFAKYSSMLSSLTAPLSQSFDTSDQKAVDYLNGQYNIVSGKIAENKNEIMLVVDSDRKLADLSLAWLGYYTQEEFINLAYMAIGEEAFNPDLVKDKEGLEQYGYERFSYDEIMGSEKTFKFYPSTNLYTQAEDVNPMELIQAALNGGVVDASKYHYDPYYNGADGIELKIVGILEPKDGLSYGALSSGFYYTEDLARYMIEQNLESEIVKFINGTTNKSVSSSAILYPKGADFNGMAVGGDLYYFNGVTFEYHYKFESDIYTQRTTIGSPSQLSSLMSMFAEFMGGGGGGGQPSEDEEVDETPEAKVLANSSITLREAGGVNLPNNIKLYNIDFDQKQLMLNYLDAWNNEDADIKLSDGTVYVPDSREKITYSDMLSLIISMISMFINVITIALIGFTSLALVVSCVMIAIITYVSVVERIKEIGIIRSLGGRKRDVSYLFNAETFIIGFVSGIIGIAFTYFASFIINLIVSHFAGIATIAIFPINYALIMLAVSVFLTLVSGLVPSASAAKKDPVVALRSE